MVSRVEMSWCDSCVAIHDNCGTEQHIAELGLLDSLFSLIIIHVHIPYTCTLCILQGRRNGNKTCKANGGGVAKIEYPYRPS